MVSRFLTKNGSGRAPAKNSRTAGGSARQQMLELGCRIASRWRSEKQPTPSDSSGELRACAITARATASASRRLMPLPPRS